MITKWNRTSTWLYLFCFFVFYFILFFYLLHFLPNTVYFLIVGLFSWPFHAFQFNWERCRKFKCIFYKLSQNLFHYHAFLYTYFHFVTFFFSFFFFKWVSALWRSSRTTQQFNAARQVKFFLLFSLFSFIFH